MNLRFIKISIISFFIIIFSVNPIKSQTINRYIFLHPNRKNDSQIKPSPLSSPYSDNRAIEFTYEPVPTESMKARVRYIFEKMAPETNDIYQNDMSESMIEKFYEQPSTLMQELDNEAKLAIKKQNEKDEKEQLEIQRKNLASYTANLNAKKKQAEQSTTVP